MTPRVLRDPEPCVLGAGLSFAIGFATTAVLIAAGVLLARRFVR